MKKKIIIIASIAALAVILSLTFFIYNKSTAESQNTAEKEQLYTCGMHPFIIMHEPGNCPICGMKLVPVKDASNANNKEKKALYYRNPMDPSVISDHPQKDEMGMDYVPVYEDGNNSSGLVDIDPAVVQNMNVKTVPVEVKELSSTVITNGVLKTNETQDYIVTTRINGYIQKLYVNYTGQNVRKGQKLMDIYSPELMSAEQELLTAISYQSSVSKTDITSVAESGNDLVKNAERKLQLYEVPESEIRRIENTKEINTYVTLYAQNSGTVISKNILEGQKIMAGQPLMEISNLSTLWLTADVYEYELSKIELGSKAKVRFSYFPGKEFNGRVSFIYPTIDPKSRTAKIRIDINNANGKMMPEMFANVEIYGTNLGKTTVVPENSVIRSGEKDLVIIALGNGKFKPQQVTLGGYSNGYYQVLKGLEEGNEIVTSAQFLIDSESNIKSAISQLQSSIPVKQKEELPEQSSFENNESKGSDMSGMKIGDDENINHDKDAESIIRTGKIDLAGIDVNKDGKVYQDMMDWNVISDKPGTCPVCGMKLKEVSLKEASENLIKHGFKVKKESFSDRSF